MKQKKNKNPLSGMAEFDKEGNLCVVKGIKFGGEMKPKITPREWFYLLLEACKEKEYPTDKLGKFFKNTLGSSATQWRTKNSLIKKGHL